jgi:NAD(P)-dependent dehydrogenase (short-subunit alcohol dehydrogenase family)
MTGAHLSARQIQRLADATHFKRLTPLEAVVGAIEFLCSAQNTGITGQSITVDLGYSHARLV